MNVAEIVGGLLFTDVGQRPYAASTLLDPTDLSQSGSSFGEVLKDLGVPPIGSRLLLLVLRQVQPFDGALVDLVGGG